jgi:hypothetical protein
MTNRGRDDKLNKRKKGGKPGKERQGNVSGTDKQIKKYISPV